VADENAAGGQHLLDHAQAEWEAEVEPDRAADDLGRESVAGVRGLGRRDHAEPVAAFPLVGNRSRLKLTVPSDKHSD
jgi:hypothetical protein